MPYFMNKYHLITRPCLWRLLRLGQTAFLMRRLENAYRVTLKIPIASDTAALTSSLNIAPRPVRSQSSFALYSAITRRIARLLISLTPLSISDI
jgi:hypothetical protein